MATFISLACMMLYSFGGLLQFVGFMLLCRMKGMPFTLRMILLNLSATEFISSLMLVIHKAGRLSQEVIQMSSILTEISDVMVKALIIFLVLDTYLDWKLKASYPHFLTKFVALKVLACLWVGFSTVILLLTLFDQHQYWNVFGVIFYTLDGVILSIVVLTAMRFCARLHSYDTLSTPMHSVESQGDDMNDGLKFFIPFYIIIMYTVINMTGGVFRLVFWIQNGVNYQESHTGVSHLLNSFGYLSHAAVYAIMKLDVKCRGMTFINGILCTDEPMCWCHYKTTDHMYDDEDNIDRDTEDFIPGDANELSEDAIITMPTENQSAEIQPEQGLFPKPMNEKQPSEQNIHLEENILEAIATCAVNQTPVRYAAIASENMSSNKNETPTTTTNFTADQSLSPADSLLTSTNSQISDRTTLSKYNAKRQLCVGNGISRQTNLKLGVNNNLERPMISFHVKPSTKLDLSFRGMSSQYPSFAFEVISTPPQEPPSRCGTSVSSQDIESNEICNLISRL